MTFSGQALRDDNPSRHPGMLLAGICPRSLTKEESMILRWQRSTLFPAISVLRKADPRHEIPHRIPEQDLFRAGSAG